MSDRLWSYTESHDRLAPLECALEHARERIAAGSPEPQEIREFRPPQPNDVDAKFLADEVWDFLVERLHELEDMATDEGGVQVLPASFREQDDRPETWHAIKRAVQSVLLDHADLSDAAWQETGRRMLVWSHSSSSY